MYKMALESEIWGCGPRQYDVPCLHGPGAKMQIRQQLLVPSVCRQASSSHGQCVGNNSADQNSSAPRLLALTLKQSPETGHGEARLLGGYHGVKDVLPYR